MQVFLTHAIIQTVVSWFTLPAGMRMEMISE